MKTIIYSFITCVIILGAYLYGKHSTLNAIDSTPIQLDSIATRYTEIFGSPTDATSQSIMDYIIYDDVNTTNTINNLNQ